MAIWRKQEAAVFAISVSCFAFLCNVIALGPQFQLSISLWHVVIGSKFVFTMAAPAIPAIVCVAIFKEARLCVRRLGTSWRHYPISLLIGIAIPMTAYLGSHSSSSPFQEGSGFLVIKITLMNLFLSPLWEEVIWRGTFLNKLDPTMGPLRALIFSSFAWLLWHAGYFLYLHSEGIDATLLVLLIPVIFCSGIIFGVIFESTKPHASVWPSVVLHASFNASTLVYYGGFGRLSERSSYICEDIFICIAAAIALTWLRRLRPSRRQNGVSAVQET